MFPSLLSKFINGLFASAVFVSIWRGAVGDEVPIANFPELSNLPTSVLLV